MSRTDHDSTYRGLAQVTNSRQAAKILDVDATGTLHLSWPSGREWWITGSDEGLYVVGYARSGGLYLSRTLPIGTVQANARGAADVDVVHEPGDVPDAVYRGSRSDGS